MRKITIEIEDEEVSLEVALKVVEKVIALGKVEKNHRGYPTYKATTIFKNGVRVSRKKTVHADYCNFKVDKYLIDESRIQKV